MHFTPSCVVYDVRARVGGGRYLVEQQAQINSVNLWVVCVCVCGIVSLTDTLLFLLLLQSRSRTLERFTRRTNERTQPQPDLTPACVHNTDRLRASGVNVRQPAPESSARPRAGDGGRLLLASSSSPCERVSRDHTHKSPLIRSGLRRS